MIKYKSTLEFDFEQRVFFLIFMPDVKGLIVASYQLFGVSLPRNIKISIITMHNKIILGLFVLAVILANTEAWTPCFKLTCNLRCKATNADIDAVGYCDQNDKCL